MPTDIRDAWSIDPRTIYLNHGSFGPPPNVVRELQRQHNDALNSQPMRYFVRELEPEWLAARDALADFVGAARDDLALVENATYAMNVVANSFPLEHGDEVLLTNHEYGAVQRIWSRQCERVGATTRVVAIEDDDPSTTAGPWLTEPQRVVERIVQAIRPSTRLLVLSHITSATALILPVEAIVRAAQAKGVAVCIDGPHAVAQLPLDLEELGCDFYCASCHKWLSASFGTGFVYAAPRWRDQMSAPILSWGRIQPATPASWVDELLWTGTRMATNWSSIPTAIDFLRSIGLERFRQTSHELARYAAQRLQAIYDLPPLAAPFDVWHGSMAHIALPDGPALPLQIRLRDEHGIETPIIDFLDRRWIRVSCHLYNDQSDIDALAAALPAAVEAARADEAIK